MRLTISSKTEKEMGIWICRCLGSQSPCSRKNVSTLSPAIFAISITVSSRCSIQRTTVPTAAEHSSSAVPFRFFRDDHESPKKKGFWRRNQSDQLFAPSDAEAVVFRFIVQRPLTENDELEIYFVGYNAVEDALCEWRFGDVRILSSTDDQLPDAVHQDAPHAELLDTDDDVSRPNADTGK
jgi:hypothetical protein